VIGSDLSNLSPANRLALGKIVAAAQLMTAVCDRQTWQGAAALRAQLESDKSDTGQSRSKYFHQNGGPWSALDHHKTFIDGVPERPAHANFYPDDLTAEEFDTWLKGLDASERAKATGFFHVIRRDAAGKLITVPFSEEYKEQLAPAAQLLREAAELTDSESLANFLKLRADALLTNDYVESDIAWLHLDSPIELTFGPYETYMDEFRGAKAAFQAYVALRDDAQTDLLKKFSLYMQYIEDRLPMARRYRNPKVASSAPIRVVNLILGSGFANKGVQTAAFNLPNEDDTVAKHGTKQTMLRNVQEAKFRQVLLPIAAELLHPALQSRLSFNAFFTFILMHELCHGLGPHNIKVKGRSTSVRLELKECYSAIEEAKADVCGLIALQLLVDEGAMAPELADEMYVTFIAGLFRSIRFGINEAHGRSNVVQFNRLRDGRAVTFDKATGTFKVNVKRVKLVLNELAREILTIEAKGDYKAAKALLARYAVLRPRTKKALAQLESVPVDIEPDYATATEILKD
jgi:hypothetical protein